MREKDHSPRKMLQSPKQGAVYPLPGYSSSSSSTITTSSSTSTILPQVPYDLSNRSSSSNLLHQQQLASDQPLDLRVERKKTSPSNTSTSSSHSTERGNSSSDDGMEDENSNVIDSSINNKEDCRRSPSPLNMNNNNVKISNNNYITVKDELRLSSISTPSQSLFPPPSLHPLMLGKFVFVYFFDLI